MSRFIDPPGLGNQMARMTVLMKYHFPDPLSGSEVMSSPNTRSRLDRVNLLRRPRSHCLKQAN